MAIAMSVLLFGSCKKEIKTTDATALNATASDDLQAAGAGHVFILSNQITSNEVLTYRRSANGKLSFGAAYPTGGTGTGGGLGNQGAVIVSQDGKLLLAVNAGSNSLSSLKITDQGLQLISTVNSGGIQPVSITQHGKLVYVLNSGGEGNIAGFKLTSYGALQPLSNSVRPLTDTAVGAAQISFVQNGTVVAITEKATNTILTYNIRENGRPGNMHKLVAANPTPFGFAVGRNNIIYVSEAVGGAPNASTLSSYYIAPNGSIKLVTGPVGANQSAACWVVLSGDGRYAYTTNTGSNNVSSFRISATGNVKVENAIAAVSGMGPIDADIDNASKYLYVLNGAGQSISAYSIDAGNGALNDLQTAGGLPIGATGLTAE